MGETVTIIKDLVTTFAIVGAGAWALWTWLHSERLRRNREMASPDGHLSVTELELRDDWVLVTLKAIWRNRGPAAIELCADHSKVEVYAIDCGQDGPRRVELSPGPGVEPLIFVRSPWSSYVMEPSTDSEMVEHFRLKKSLVYGFRWIICMVPGSIPGRHARSHLECVREIVWTSDREVEAI